MTRVPNPANQTIATWTSRNATSDTVTRKCSVRADCRPPSDRDRGRHRRDERRRHRQARPDDEREQHEDHEEVGEPLHQVVRPRVRGGRPRESEVLREGARKRPQRTIARLGQQVFAEMAADGAPDDIQRAGQHQQPRRLEMEIAAPAVLVGQHVAISGRDGCARRGNRDPEQRGRQDVAALPPVEAWVRDDDLESADQQREEAQPSSASASPVRARRDAVRQTRVATAASRSTLHAVSATADTNTVTSRVAALLDFLI